MSCKRHPIRRHRFCFDASGGMVRLTLWDQDDREVAQLGFIEPDRRLPAAQVSPTLDYGVGFLSQATLLPLLVLLSQATPIYLVLDDDPVGSICIHT